MFTCGLPDLLLLAVGSLVVFVLREYSSVLNINYAKTQILVSCLVYIDQLLFLTWTNCWYFFNNAYYQELCILIIEFINVVNLAEW
jgi:hypothetical protein